MLMFTKMTDEYNSTCHPIEKGYSSIEWIEVIKDMYKDKEVKDMLYYSNPNYDPVTCPANWLWDASLRPKPTWGIEVIWKDG